MEEVTASKREVRKRLLALRKALPEKREKSWEISRLLLGSEAYRSASRLLLYLSTSQEADTFGILRQALKDQKEVYAPVCSEREGEMTFYRVRDPSALIIGKYGILEPKPFELLPEGRELPSTLCVVPGVAFGRDGARMGYGKGYYDRFLVKRQVTAIGLCYHRLLFSRLPCEPHDRRMQAVITEKGIFRARKIDQTESGSSPAPAPGKDG